MAARRPKAEPKAAPEEITPKPAAEKASGPALPAEEITPKAAPEPAEADTAAEEAETAPQAPEPPAIPEPLPAAEKTAPLAAFSPTALVGGALGRTKASATFDVERVAFKVGGVSESIPLTPGSYSVSTDKPVALALGVSPVANPRGRVTIAAGDVHQFEIGRDQRLAAIQPKPDGEATVTVIKLSRTA